MKVKIKGKEYDFNMTGWWGPLYKFEDLMDKANHPDRAFNPVLTFHLHVMFYSILMCDNDALDFTIEEFFEALADLELANRMTEFYLKRVAVLTQGQSKSESESDSKKKS